MLPSVFSELLAYVKGVGGYRTAREMGKQALVGDGYCGEEVTRICIERVGCSLVTLTDPQRGITQRLKDGPRTVPNFRKPVGHLTDHLIDDVGRSINL